MEGTQLYDSSSSSGYLPSPDDERNVVAVSSQPPPLYPQAGDFVRFTDLDGGQQDGQVMVGRIRFIQKNVGGEGSGWTLELVEMDDLGQGYYADYGSRQRWTKGSVYRDLRAVSPLSASFVRSENAYKIPTKVVGEGDDQKRQLIVKAEQYTVEGYTGPFASASSSIDTAVVEADGVLYEALKGKLFRYAAIAGAIGAIVAEWTQGTELAAIYLAGVLSSLLYLLFLSFKTDTIGTEQSQFGKNISSLRFFMPVVVLVGVALYNASLGEANPLVALQAQQQAAVLDTAVSSSSSAALFQFVTPSQFAAAITGFLTYRLPLLLIQVEDAFAGDGNTEGDVVLPGSLGIMASSLQQQQSSSLQDGQSATANDALTTVFLISGPQATGRDELVEQFVQEGQGKYVTPTLVDRIENGVTFEQLQARGELLKVDDDRYGLTLQAIQTAATTKATDKDEDPPIVVVNANVPLVEKLARISGLRLVGVWVGLSSVAEFEQRLNIMFEQGLLSVDDNERTREETIRTKIREIVKEIEYGISCGIFEFTILNDNPEQSLKQLREAAKYVK